MRTKTTLWSSAKAGMQIKEAIFMRKFWFGIVCVVSVTIVLLAYFSKPKYVSLYKPYRH